MVEAMGGSCAICGYLRCRAALEFHHLDPKEKDFSFGNKLANPRSWDVLVNEMRKCVMLCATCHREVHEGMTALPDVFPRFDERFADYKALAAFEKLEPCPVCAKPKSPRQITCSSSCAGRSRGKVDWDAVDLVGLMSRMSMVAIGDLLGCSDVAVRKRWKKIQPKADIPM